MSIKRIPYQEFVQRLCKPKPFNVPWVANIEGLGMVWGYIGNEHAPSELDELLLSLEKRGKVLELSIHWKTYRQIVYHHDWRAILPREAIEAAERHKEPEE